MKILHVIPSMNPSYGGPCQGIRNMDIPLNNLFEVNIEIVCLSDKEESFLSEDKFILHALGRGDRLWSYNAKLRKWLKENLQKFDIVIINGLWQYHSYIVEKLIRKLKNDPKQKSPKLVIMPHGGLDPWFQREKSRRIKAFRNYIYWELIERRVINNADALFFTCEDELLLARETFRKYYPKMELNVGFGIPYPPIFNLNMNKAFNDKVSNLEDKIFWLFLSRIHPKKGVDTLIEAYKKVLEEGEKKRINIPKLVVAGPGLETDYGQEILSKVKEHPLLEKNVEFTGMIKGDIKWGAMYGCEVFILASHQENFGIAIVEAMACAKPVIITDKVNIWREIQQGGGLVDKDTLEGTYNSLVKWLTISNDDKKDMSVSAHSTYEKFFTIQKGVEGFHNGLLKVLNTQTIVDEISIS